MLSRTGDGLAPSPLEGEGWGEGEDGLANQLCCLIHLPPLPQPLPHEEGGE